LRQKYWRIKTAQINTENIQKILAATKSSKIIKQKLSKYWRLPKILAHTRNVGACSKYRRLTKI
jgi:hypothetical protein